MPSPGLRHHYFWSSNLHICLTPACWEMMRLAHTAERGLCSRHQKVLETVRQTCSTILASFIRFHSNISSADLPQAVARRDPQRRCPSSPSFSESGTSSYSACWVSVCETRGGHTQLMLEETDPEHVCARTHPCTRPPTPTHAVSTFLPPGGDGDKRASVSLHSTAPSQPKAALPKDALRSL